MTATRLTNPQGTARQGLAATSRRDPWWLVPGIIATGFGLFIAYSLFSALIWDPFFHVPYHVDGYLSPFYSPEIRPDWLPSWISPAVLILWIPLGFRTTCYYYRKAYYRSYFADPPACAVGEPTIHRRYAMERAFPFILQNLHRYFLYLAFVPLFFLWVDGFYSFVNTGPRIGLGSFILLGNAFLLTGYSFSCHSLRHLAGGRLDCFSCGVAAKVRYRAWQRLTGLNERHMLWAWVSLVAVALADLYVRLLAWGVIVDPAIRL
ncbi:MAG TPA: succinate dehydrogenase [Candidatus Limnocylindria bacterium]|jgi:hypothetical protein